MKFVMCCAVADESIVVTAELADHISEGEDGAEDEFRIIGRGAGLVRLAGRRKPGFGVDALG